MKHLSTSLCGLLNKLGNSTFSLLVLFFCLFPVWSIASSEPVARVAVDSDSDSSGGGSDTALPDLFTGTMSYKIPIEVPAGRNGMDPGIALKYRSSNGNGWIGVGWELEVGSIQRSAKNGVNFDGDSYQFKTGNSTSEIVNVGNNEYLAKIESKFSRIRKLTATDGRPYWEVTDNKGIRFLFGQSTNSRQDDPENTTRIYKWCLDKIVDPNGNYTNISYFKDQGEIYLDKIEYAGNGTLAPTNTVNFYRETRSDALEMYTTNFKVKTAYRLKTIYVQSNVVNSTGIKVRAYNLGYAIKTHALQSDLVSVQQFGNDATLDANGAITGGSILLTSTFQIPDSTSSFTTPDYNNPAFPATIGGYFSYHTTDIPYISSANFMRNGDFNGDGITDYMWIPANGDGRWLIAYGTKTGFTTPDYSNPALPATIGGYLSYHTTDKPYLSSANYMRNGDFNGDGKTDYMWIPPGGDGRWLVAYGTETGFTIPDYNHPALPGRIDGYLSYFSHETLRASYMRNGDFNGDGKTDYMWMPPGGDGRWLIAYGTETGFTIPVYNNPALPAKIGVYLSYHSSELLYISSDSFMRVGDFNGDGKTDYMWMPANGDGRWLIAYGTETGLTIPDYAHPALPATIGGYFSYHTSDKPYISSPSYMRDGDFNGDGKTDYMWIPANGDGRWLIAYGTGTGLTIPDYVHPALPGRIDGYLSYFSHETLRASYMRNGDFNGDGKTDYMWMPPGGDGRWLIAYGTGYGLTIPEYAHPALPATIGGYFSYHSSALPYILSDTFMRTGDFNGDGKEDYMWMPANGDGRWLIAYSGDQSNLISDISNNLGFNAKITYTPSTTYSDSNIQLPFPLQTVQSITTCDNYNFTTSTCAGNAATTSFSFAGGFYNISDRDLRGFNYAKATGPAGPNGDQKITETWFHQGNETGLIPDDASKEYLKAYANIRTGYMKGKPYRTRVTDVNGNKYSETTTIYSPDANNESPYFTPPLQVDSYIYDGGTNYIQTRKVYTYDGYGNIVREEHYGDVNDTADDAVDRTIVRAFLPNISNWIIGLPYREETYQGIGADPAKMLAAANYYYDDATAPDCSAVSTRQSPDKGKVTRIQRLLKYDTLPITYTEERKAYNSYGNLICSRDANGNTTKTGYDASNTFPISVTTPPTPKIPSGLTTIMRYYGVDGVSGNGLYGQKQSETDPNGAVTLYEYDKFGRKTLQRGADGFQTVWKYLDFGTGQQRIRTETSDGVWSESYFDGLNRTIKDYKIGPDSLNTYSRSDTAYDVQGNVFSRTTQAFPQDYAVAAATPVTNTYDLLGRVTTATSYIDATHTAVTRTCYDRDVTVTIDPNGHRKREVRDANGKLVKVQEYKGTYSSCTTEEGAPPNLYATTTYTYDVLGNLLTVTDVKGNRTEMRYDSLGRKRYMSDPDMGTWTYGYDANGNLTSQTDAKQQTITFYYDSLNRLYKKQFPTGTDVVMTYDEVATNYFNKGRLTKMTDASGQTVYNYDNMGRTGKSTKTINGTSYTLEFAYLNGRLDKVTYPDTETVSYEYYYDGNLKKAGSYVTYSNLDAFGRPANAVYGTNKASSSYGYDPVTRRLSTLSVLSPTEGLLIDNTYFYDKKGNITSITDNLNISLPTNYSNDTFTPARAHAIGLTGSGRQFIYDNNGNLCNDNGYLCSDTLHSISYNYENMPVTMPTSTGNIGFVYDGNGTRTIKTTPSGYTHYIDKYYENTNGSFTKYIYAGTKRVATKTGTVVLYYHPDHLGSTSVVTNALGGKEERIAYYPFGETRQDIGAVINLKHKYTGQELDKETNFYNYGARLYDPEIGRFVTPDSIVPDYTNPQSLNRYAYTLNNPMRYVDPTGHDEIDAENAFFGTGNDYDIGGSEWGTRDSGWGGSGNYSYSSNWVFYLNSAWNGFVHALPGQASGQNAMSAFSSGNYLNGIIFGTISLIDDAMFAASMGSSSLLSRTATTLAESAEAVAGTISRAARSGVAAYEVGTYKSLQALSAVGDDLAIHHVGQSHAMKQVVLGFTRGDGAAIVLPTLEHQAIATLKGAYEGSARSLLANDIVNLRNFTGAPNSSLMQLIELNKRLYPRSFRK